MCQVLVVEDDPDARSALAELLTCEGYDVITAANGAEAVKIIEESHAGIDIVLLDMMMPVMSGWEVLERMKGMSADVVLQTGVQCLYGGHLPMLRKPYEPDDMLDLVSAYVEPCRRPVHHAVKRQKRVIGRRHRTLRVAG